MNILVVGGGGREHALVKALKKSPRCTRLYCCPGNGGIAEDAECVNIRATDLDTMLAFAVQKQIDFAVVAPDDPLVMGMADRLSEAGIRVFGPSQAAAMIEGSKAFAKNLMKKYGIPTARYEVFTDADAALAYIAEQERYPLVVKADGLALGKGVLIAGSAAEAEQAVRSMMCDAAFGKSGSTVVIEEFLTGPEVSVLAFTDGKTVRPMISSMDHKRALDGDQGLNTGGMGTVAPNPYYTPEIAAQCMETIFLPTVRAMRAEGRPFKGCLYFGLMLTPDGPKVIEYNCRFGDPEAQVVLPLLETDLLAILEAVADERLDKVDIRWSDGAAVCVILASGGYPQKYETGKVISGCERVDKDILLYHAGTRRSEEGFVTAGGRVLGVTARGADLQEAIDAAYAAVDKLDFEGMQFRRDIGQRALQAE